MGVPAFFRWLSKKYPSIVVHCVEEKKKDVDGNPVPLDTSGPNPNDYEFDNLYLDMNGIIHPCSHPENKPAPKNEAEMMVAIFEYIDRIFSIVRPRKLLYMAIDGPAPRAKMNQQRSRRFRAAKESRESKETIANIKARLREQGAILPPEPEKKESFDSNCITPGTEFMDRLAVCLRYYIADRINSDPGWKNIKVILSDANVPGEGEHKIMDYIRKQRAQPDHDPDTKHCLNGADADLIMLGLATHELHFTIMREEFKPGQKKPCEICGQEGHEKDDCEGLPKDFVVDESNKWVGTEVEFIFIRLNVLREYLERELRMDGLPFAYDFERAVDDWIFMCFFVGNDFLPHLPSLEIREGAIDRLQQIYKRCLPRLGGYLSESGHASLKRVAMILKELGEVEDEIFRKRQQFEERMKRRREDQERQAKRQKMMEENTSMRSHQPLMGSTPFKLGTPNRPPPTDLRKLLTPTPDGDPNQSFASPSTSMNSSTASTPGGTPGQGVKRKREEDSPKKPEEPVDEIRLWEDGWKERYYLHKFSISKERDAGGFHSFRKHVANEYVLGLTWVLRYYFQGCPSWKWFYPYHYAPFASDFEDIEKVDIEFEKGTGPFNPLEQLMSVFPAASGKFLPPTWRELMSAADSPIIDFYPTDFKVDLNGKRFAWQGVALLPFVDQGRLERSLAKVYPDLTEDEKRRNTRGQDVLFVGKANPLYDFFVGLHESKMLTNDERHDVVTDFSHGMRGKVFNDDTLVEPGSVFASPVPGLEDLKCCTTFSVRFENPEYDEDYVFPAKVLEKATPPDRVLKPGDVANIAREWRGPQTGMSPRNQSYQVSPGGHRMIRHELNRSGGSYQGSPGFGSSFSSGGYSPNNRSFGGGNFNSPRGGFNSPRGGFNSPNNFNSPRGGYNRGGGGGGWNMNNSFGGRGGNNFGGNRGHNRSFSQGGSDFNGRGGYQDQRRRSDSNLGNYNRYNQHR